ncbi:hypothetical protein BD410DRAFT_794298, partial [Rickenella mellea]
MESASVSLSSVSASSFSSTILGIGMIAGRGVKRVGQTIIHFAEEPILWHRLKIIEKHVEDRTLRSAMFSDAQMLHCVIVDLVEFLQPGHSVTGHSLTGYPKRINRLAAALYQEIHQHILNVPGYFYDDVINEVLSSCCRTYWFFKKMSRQLELEDQVVQICFLLDGVRTLGPRGWLKQEIAAQSCEVLCDFAASIPRILESWDLHTYFATHHVFKAFSFKWPYSRVEYRVLFEDGFLMAMAWLSEGNLPHDQDVSEYDNKLTDIFRPLILTNAEFEVHLTSLSCAYTHLLSRLPYARYLGFLTPLPYPFERYQSIFPDVDVIAQLNVDFIHKIIMGLISSIADYGRSAPPGWLDPFMLHEEYQFVCMAFKCLGRLAEAKASRAMLLNQHPMYQDIPAVVQSITGQKFAPYSMLL